MASNTSEVVCEVASDVACKAASLESRTWALTRIWFGFSKSWFCAICLAAMSLVRLARVTAWLKVGGERKISNLTREKRLATQHAMCASALLAVLLLVVWALGSIFDPVGCAAGAYLWILLMMQTRLLEYPGGHVFQLRLAIGVIGSVASPTVAFYLGYWQPSTRFVLWLVDFIICHSAYDTTVRGAIFVTGGMRGRVCLVTGSSTGIGYETAKALAKAGAVVIFACRNAEKAQLAMDKLINECEGRVKEEQLIFMELDLASISNIRDFAEEFYRSELDLHVLCLNAGAMASQPRLTEDLLDEGLASNHLGHFLLVKMLLPKILATERKVLQEGGSIPRIVSVSSALVFEHVSSELVDGVAFKTDNFDMFRHYGQTKLASMMCLKVLADRLKSQGSQVPVNAVHPGEIATDISRDFTGVLGVAAWISAHCKSVIHLFMKTPQEGAMATLHACCSKSRATAAQGSGQFLFRWAPAPPHPALTDKEACEKAWSASEFLVGCDKPKMA